MPILAMCEAIRRIITKYRGKVITRILGISAPNIIGLLFPLHFTYTSFPSGLA